jgi:hypothetical protein
MTSREVGDLFQIPKQVAHWMEMTPVSFQRSLPLLSGAVFAAEVVPKIH